LAAVRNAGAEEHRPQAPRDLLYLVRVTILSSIADRLARARADNALHHIYTQILDARVAAAGAIGGAMGAPLFGVPVAIKDNIDVAGVPTSCGRRVSADAAPASAAIVTRLESLGAVVIGKTNLDEAALGASGRNARFGRCGNPRLPDRLSGGSSSGSAAAVAAGHALLGIGTDTLGSVRIPAAFCGIVGFKPSHGRLPTAGIAPLYPRYDSVGLLAASLADISRVATLLLGGQGTQQGTQQDLVRRVTVLDATALTSTAPDVARDYRHCVARLQASDDPPIGAAPTLDWQGTAHAALWEVAHEFAERSTAEAPGYRALDDIDAELGRLLARAMRLPREKLAAGRTLLAESAAKLTDCLAGADALLTPTCPENAPRSDADPAKHVAAFTAPANLAGLPAVSWTEPLAGGHSVSLQLIGRHGEDLQLIDLAAQLRRQLGRESPAAG